MYLNIYICMYLNTYIYVYICIHMYPYVTNMSECGMYDDIHMYLYNQELVDVGNSITLVEISPGSSRQFPIEFDDTFQVSCQWFFFVFARYH